MINIDDRLLNELDESEMYLVLHIAKHMKANRMTAWPSLDTLSKACKWDERTIKKHRQSLIEKGFLEMKMQAGKPTLYRFLKDGIGVYHGLQTSEMVAENEGAFFEGGTKNEGTQNDDEGGQKMYPEVIKKEGINVERDAPEKNSLSPAETFALESEKEKQETSAAGAGGAPVTTPPTHRINLGDRPRAETPAELEISLRAFYTDWPNEWSVGIMENGRGAKYGKEKCREIVKDFCCWAIENGRGADTYRQLNARLQGWFRNEQHTAWKQQRQQPSQETVYTSPKNAVY